LFANLLCVLESGQWLYVSGVNGVGKTSLLRMVCGLACIEMGDILWNGQSIRTQRHAYHRDLCYLGHSNALQESMTVHENVAFRTALGGLSADPAQTQGVLARFGLAGRGHQLVRHLSQGQKRRVALCCLALSTARLWVLDEPYVAMDEAGIGLLAGLIANHLEGGGLAVLTSHQRVLIDNHAPRVLEIQPP